MVFISRCSIKFEILVQQHEQLTDLESRLQHDLKIGSHDIFRKLSNAGNLVISQQSNRCLLANVVHS